MNWSDRLAKVCHRLAKALLAAAAAAVIAAGCAGSAEPPGRSGEPARATAAAADRIVAVSRGELAACALRAGGTVDCWDLLAERPVARAVPGARQVTALAATRDGFTCAVERAGTVACRDERCPGSDRWRR